MGHDSADRSDFLRITLRKPDSPHIGLTEVRLNVVLLEIVQLHVLHDPNDLERPLVRKYVGLQQCDRICVVMRSYAATEIEGGSVELAAETQTKTFGTFNYLGSKRIEGPMFGLAYPGMIPWQRG